MKLYLAEPVGQHGSRFIKLIRMRFGFVYVDEVTRKYVGKGNRKLPRVFYYLLYYFIIVALFVVLLLYI
jgi:hypothetical protein